MGVWDSFAQGLEIGNAMRSRARDEQQRSEYGAAFQRGGFGEVANTAGGYGDLDTATQAQGQVQTQERTRRQQALENAQIFGNIATYIGAVPETDMAGRQQRLAAVTPRLQEFGFTPEQIAQADLTDQGLEAYRAAVGGVSQYVDIIEQGNQVLGLKPDGTIDVLHTVPPQPGPTFQVISPNEIPQGALQRNAQTGEISPINNTRGSPLERAQASADVERVTQFRQMADRDQMTAMQLQRFVGLNEQEPGTGPGSLGSVDILGFTPFRNQESQQMAAISADLTPEQREPGSGATSDFDARMFREALPGLDKSPEANRAMAQAYAIRAELMGQRAQIAEAWLESGSLNGFDAAWRRYVAANPIFDPAATPDNPRLNPNRQDFITWAQSNGVELGASASQQLQTPAPTSPQTAPPPDSVEAIDARIRELEEMERRLGGSR